MPRNIHMRSYFMSLPLHFHNEQFSPPASHRLGAGAGPAPRNPLTLLNFCVIRLCWITSSVISFFQSHSHMRHLIHIPIPATGSIPPASASSLYISYPIWVSRLTWQP